VAKARRLAPARAQQRRSRLISSADERRCTSTLNVENTASPFPGCGARGTAPPTCGVTRLLESFEAGHQMAWYGGAYSMRARGGWDGETRHSRDAPGIRFEPENAEKALVDGLLVLVRHIVNLTP
jgi:hypothetical protein